MKTPDVAADNSLSALEARREKVEVTRNKAQRQYNLLIPMAFVLPLIGTILGWYFLKKISDPIILILPILYSFMPLTMILSSRLRLRQIENDLQELEFRIDLQKFEVSKRETRAEKLLKLNDIQLQRYYNLNISQNSWIFGLGVFCILLGIAVIGVTLFLVLRIAQSLEVQIITATLGSVGSILTNFIAAIYLKMNTTATDNLTSFHSRLVVTQQLLLGNLLASRIENDKKRWETLSQLSLRMIHKDN